MIDPNELERLSKAATAPGTLIADKGAFLVALETAYRTGQLVPAMPSGDEVAWLIERDDLRTAESGDRVCLHYYAESRPGRHYWTPDHLKAKRFPTRESAMVECNNDPLLRVCEHMWMGSQPSGDVVEAVARAIMVTNGACFVKDWTTERRDNPHVALAWDQATAAITAYEAASGVAKMREALRPFANVTILPDGSVVGLERHWFTDARAALGEKP